MKKIFLTSGLVLCMACPAFAVNDGAANIDVITDDQTGAVTGTEAANCVSDVLETSTAGQYVKFNALWNPNEGTISFDNSYTNTTNGSCSTARNISHSATTGPKYGSPAADLANLYTRYGIAVYPTGALRTADSNNDGAEGITSLTSPTMTGYTFGGYYLSTDTDFSGTQYVAGNGNIDDSLKNLITTVDGTATLQAKWTPDTYTITYACGSYTAAGAQSATNVARQPLASNDPNYEPGGDNNFVSNTQSVMYDDCYSLGNATNYCVAPAGYEFGGWSCASDLPGASKTLPATNNAAGYPAGTNANTLYAADTAGTWTSTDNITCTAIWKANSINLIWNANGGTGGTGGAATCTYDTAINPLPSVPTKTGYTFAGWDVVSVTDTDPDAQ